MLHHLSQNASLYDLAIPVTAVGPFTHSHMYKLRAFIFRCEGRVHICVQLGPELVLGAPMLKDEEIDCVNRLARCVSRRTHATESSIHDIIGKTSDPVRARRLRECGQLHKVRMDRVVYMYTNPLFP